jgi:hypothetical protein
MLAAVPLTQPRHGSIHDRTGRPLDRGEIAALDTLIVERVVVGLVPLSDAPA